MQTSKLLKNSKARFDSRFQDSLSLFHSSQFWFEHSGESYTPIKKLHRSEIAALSFIGLVLAWEEFLEDSFLILMVRAKARTRGCKSRVDVGSREQAFDMVKGDTHRGYIEWSSVKVNKERALRYFKDGKPFETPLGAGAVHFKRIQKIRNRIAHRSKYSQEQFNDLVRELFGAFRRMTPGELLLKPPPANFGLLPTALPSPTILKTYADIVNAVVHQIAA